jgi:hypothetical protein
MGTPDTADAAPYNATNAACALEGPKTVVPQPAACRSIPAGL